jgi:hypothetical protein
LLEGRYLPIDQLTDLVSVPLKLPHIAPKAFFPDERIVLYGPVTAARLNGSL